VTSPVDASIDVSERCLTTGLSESLCRSTAESCRAGKTLWFPRIFRSKDSSLYVTARYAITLHDLLQVTICDSLSLQRPQHEKPVQNTLHVMRRYLFSSQQIWLQNSQISRTARSARHFL
jgi:hypothetical protein